MSSSAKDGAVQEETMLSQLMTALAAGARAVQGLPLEDEYDYQISYPEFRQLVESNHESLIDVLLLALSSSSSLSDHFNDYLGLEIDSLDDPLLWEACADICDGLLEQAEHYSSSTNMAKDLRNARDQANTSFGRLMQGIVEMEKPQDVYKFSTTLIGREEPFIPPITEKYHALNPLDLTLHPGHGIESRFGNLKLPTGLPNSIVAPSSHVLHCYRSELTAFAYNKWQLKAPSSKPPKIPKATTELTATWIDTPESLQKLTRRLKTEDIREIALDVEAHSYRSFDGMTCLIQMTFSKENFLIDPFPLWKHLSQALGPILANPKIVKVFHGADSDVQWLQRDFGLYLVNLFDTGRAARVLRLAGYGYAHLLHHYVGIIADKSHQLSDWRQRPLPRAMQEYAIMDTHYLLDIYERMKYDLSKHPTASIKDVLDLSREVCCIRYAPAPFKPDGYRSLMKRERRGRPSSTSKTELNETQEQVLKALWDWRDQIARQADESHAYVCTNTALLRLALACPGSLTALQGLLQPMPSLLLRNSKELLALIQSCQPQHSKSPLRSSAFFKPAVADDDADAHMNDTSSSNRVLRSPVLGTEALYRQAGWVSPNLGSSDGGSMEVEDIVTTATEDDGGDEDQGKQQIRPRRLLTVHRTNQTYESSQFTSHSLKLGASSKEEESSEVYDEVDGLGPARATNAQDVEEEARLAHINATAIRKTQENHVKMIGLISPTPNMEDGTEDNEDDDDEEEDSAEKSNQEEFIIPRSMREIYRISNRNRRSKKAASPSPREAPNEKEARELEKAEAVLNARGMEGYFEDLPGTPKRQRTKSTGTSSSSASEEAQHDSTNMSREEDIALMQEIGWVKDKAEVTSMLKERDDDAEDEDASSGDEPLKDSAPKPFDYSTIGPIGAFSATPGANPFFAGAAVTGGHLNQQFGKTENRNKKPNNNGGRGKQSRRQIERPERSREGRSQVYKNR
jgi:exosome complex exonuclease RRP6